MLLHAAFVPKSAQWMVSAGRGKVKVDPAAPGWYRATVLGTGKGKGATFRLMFADGAEHPGVPFEHIRRAS